MSRKEKILLTGATGQLGSQLLKTLAPLGEVIAPSRSKLDLLRPETIRSVIAEVRPRWIVNPAAYTAVDRAETETAQAEAINSTALRIIGEEAAQLGAIVITCSTDYVFDGSGSTPWKETDTPAPLNVYGKTKLEGEKALAATGASHLIFRFSWVYEARGRNFLLRIAELARERESLSIVSDQWGAPTSARSLARMMAHVMQVCNREGIEPREVLHAADAGETSWFGFAKAITASLRAKNPNQQWASINPISSAEYLAPVRRPLNSRLDCSLLRERFGWTMPRWQDSLREVMRDIYN